MMGMDVTDVQTHDPILAIGYAKTNAELMVACRDLGYISGAVFEPTFGLGRFWTLWRPDDFTASDVDPDRAPDFTADFTDLPVEDDTFDTVVYDPPYKLNGTGGSHSSDEAYGVADKVKWQDRMDLCIRGISECVRVLCPGGHLLVKCQDQVCSGRVRWQTFAFTEEALSNGCELVDRMELISYRPQPKGRSQVHARRNHSTLLIFKRL